MLLSRTLARRRIAAGVRPGRAAAWLPVLADAAILVLAAVLLFPLWRLAIEAFRPPLAVLIPGLFLGAYVPAHVILVLSALWAAKSRWLDDDEPPRPVG